MGELVDRGFSRICTDLICVSIVSPIREMRGVFQDFPMLLMAAPDMSTIAVPPSTGRTTPVI